jgi:DNA polymerase-1
MTIASSSLILFDGHSTARRTWEAIKGDKKRGTTDPVELARRTLRSSVQSFRNALEENPTTHALCVFDHGGKNWRHRVYPEYKAHRPEADPEFKAMIPELRSRIEGVLDVQTVAIPDVEADDVIAAMVRKCIEAGMPGDKITVLTTDKDLAWLAAHGCTVRNHFEGKNRDLEWVERKFGAGLGFRHILDMLALMGDKEDNVPGMNGCGPVNAAEWIRRYGTVENLLAHAHEISGAIGDKLRAQVDAVRMSRLLVSFKTQIQCGVTFNQLQRV